MNQQPLVNKEKSTLQRVSPYLAILLLGTILYLPFASKMLYHSDSVGFALSIHRFDLKAHQPQPPGQALYVLTLRAVERLMRGSDNDTLVAVSMVATALSAVLFYSLSRTWFSPTTALLLSMMLLTSPVVWFNAEIAMRYPLGLLGCLAVSLACRRLVQGAAVAAYAVPVTWGLAAGFSHDVGVILAPLVVYCSYSQLRRSKWYLLSASALAGVAVVVWLLPLMYVSGGVRSYLGALRAKAAGDSALPFLFRGDFSFALELIGKNGIVVLLFLFLGSAGMLPLLVASGPRSFRPKPQSAFLLVWLVPGILLHCLTTVGHSGYILTYLPALLLLLGSAALPIGDAEDAELPPLRRKHQLILAGVCLQSGFFLFTPQQYWATSGHWITDTMLRSQTLEPTRSRIEEYDSTLRDLVNQIKNRFPDKETLLIVAVSDQPPQIGGIRPFYSQGRYYLPNWEQRVLYTTDRLKNFKKIGLTGSIIAEVTEQDFRLLHTNVVAIPSRVRWLVWFCDDRRQPYSFDADWVRYPLQSGASLLFADLKSGPRIVRRWGPFEFRPEGF